MSKTVHLRAGDSLEFSIPVEKDGVRRRESIASVKIISVSNDTVVIEHDSDFSALWDLLGVPRRRDL